MYNPITSYKVDPEALANALKTGYPIEKLEKHNVRILPSTYGLEVRYRLNKAIKIPPASNRHTWRD